MLHDSVVTWKYAQDGIACNVLVIKQSVEPLKAELMIVIYVLPNGERNSFYPIPKIKVIWPTVPRESACSTTGFEGKVALTR